MRNASQPSACFLVFVILVGVLSGESRAAAQTTDTVGVRAQGMGGAFTAVADDATATWWNPAGLAGGAYFNGLIEVGTHHDPDNTSGAPTAWRAETRSVAVAFPALGLSYYRLQVSEIQPQTSTGPSAAGRQEGGAIEVRSLVLNQLGATVGQSLGSHVVVGATLKLVNVGDDVLVSGSGTLDTASTLPVSGDTHAGLDVGAMAVFGPARLGLTVRNLREIELGSGPNALTLTRQARFGAALTSGTRGVIGSATLAVDADLTRLSTVFGDERRVAVGGEAWTPGRKVGARGGVSVNTIGDHRTALSGGVSVAFKKGMYADGELTGGTDLGRHGGSIGLRVTF